MSAPSVSVIIPVYNRANSIAFSIKSVFKQTHQDFELIVVDDCSQDNLAKSLASVKDFRLRLISHEENRGPAATRNTGIAAAKGQYVAFLDSDDQWMPEKLERQLRFMRTNKNLYRASCTGFQIFTSHCPEGEFRVGKPVLHNNDLSFGCRVSPGSTLMAERALFQEIGPLNESLRRLEDWDWLLRFTKKFPLAVMPDILSQVDYSLPRNINYADVHSAVDLMKKQYFVSTGLLPSRLRLRFLGSLENELSATAFKNKKYVLAFFHIFRSVFYYPYRSSDAIIRIVKAVMLEVVGGKKSAS